MENTSPGTASPAVSAPEPTLAGCVSRLPFAVFTVTLRFSTSTVLPLYKGSVLRGAFGHAFKKAVCAIPGRECAGCPGGPACGYRMVFETPVPEGSERMRKYTAAPHPFIITPVDRGQRGFAEGERLAFSHTLFGAKAISLLPYMLRAFEIAGETGLGASRAQAIVEAVHETGPTGAVSPVYRQGEGMVKEPALRFLAGPDDEKGGRVVLDFVTPVRLQRDGRILSSFDFRTFFSALLRRFTNMLYFHAGSEAELDFRGLMDTATGVRTVESGLRRFEWGRYSNRQERSMDMDGMTGRVVFDGVPAEFMALLQLGEVMHVGKGTAFGLGKYIIDSPLT